MMMYILGVFFALISVSVSASQLTNMVNPKTMRICENSVLFGNEDIHLGFWKDVRGRANLIRMVLEYSGLKYSSHYFGSSSGLGYDFSDWYGDVMPLIKLEIGQNVSLPWLVDCSVGQTRFIFEVSSVISYLLLKYNPKLLGSIESKSKVVEISEKVQELLTSFMSVSTESMLASEDALSSSSAVMSKLRELEGLAAEHMSLSSKFLFGEVTIADFAVFELVSQLGILAPGLSNEFTFLLTSASSVSSMDFMRRLMNSDRYTNQPIWPKVVEKSKYSTGFDLHETYQGGVRKFGEFLYWLGASLTASNSAMCLTYSVYTIGQSSKGFRVGSLLKFRNLYHAGLKVTSSSAVVRFFRRATRFDTTTKKDMVRRCKVALYGLVYSGTLLTSSLIDDICSSYVVCYANRVKSRNATAVLISAAEGIQKKLCGDTCTLRAEMMFSGRFSEPAKFVKAVRLFRLSGEATVGGSVLPLVVIGVLNRMTESGALSLAGYVVDKDAAIKVCDEALHNRTMGRMYSEGWDRLSLCDAAMASYDDARVIGPEDDVALTEIAALISVSEVIPGSFSCSSGKCDQACTSDAKTSCSSEGATCSNDGSACCNDGSGCSSGSCACSEGSTCTGCSGNTCCSPEGSKPFSPADINSSNYLQCKSNPLNWGKPENCDKYNPAFAHVFGQLDSLQDVLLGCKAFYYNSKALK